MTGKEGEVFANSLTKKAAYYVTRYSVYLVAGLLFIGAVQAWMMHFDRGANPTEVTKALGTACRTDQIICQANFLEIVAQKNRSQNIRDFLATRHIVALASFTIAFALSVLGAVLIFDRVTGGGSKVELNGDKGKTQGKPAQDEQIQIGWGNLFSASANSQFPGFLMCFMGMLLAGFTLWQMLGTANKTVMRDGPVYQADYNFARNFLAEGPGVSNPVSDAKARREAVEKLNKFFRDVNSGTISYPQYIALQTAAQSAAGKATDAINAFEVPNETDESE